MDRVECESHCVTLGVCSWRLPATRTLSDIPISGTQITHIYMNVCLRRVSAAYQGY